MLLAFAIIIAPRTISAHPESVSTARFTLGPAEMHVTLILPVRDLTRWFPPRRYKNYMVDVVRELAAAAGDLLVVAWDGEMARPVRASARGGQVGYIIVEEDFGIPAGASSLQVRSVLLSNLPNDHQQLAMVEDARRGPAAERILAQETLTAQENMLAVDLPEVPAVNPTAKAESVVSPSGAIVAVPSTPTRQASLSVLNPKHVAALAVLLFAVICVVVGYFRRRVFVGSASKARTYS